ncbi:hypothetical protein YC2023_041035 [Brassica napus]
MNPWSSPVIYGASIFEAYEDEDPIYNIYDMRFGSRLLHIGMSIMLRKVQFKAMNHSLQHQRSSSKKNKFLVNHHHGTIT